MDRFHMKLLSLIIYVGNLSWNQNTNSLNPEHFSVLIQDTNGTFYNPLLYETVVQLGFSLRILSRNSISRLSTAIEARCENKAQQSGVAKVRQTPQNKTWIGELAQRKRFRIVVLFSKKLTKTGVKTIPKNEALFYKSSCRLFSSSYQDMPWRLETK